MLLHMAHKSKSLSGRKTKCFTTSWETRNTHWRGMSAPASWSAPAHRSCSLCWGPWKEESKSSHLMKRRSKIAWKELMKLQVGKETFARGQDKVLKSLHYTEIMMESKRRGASGERENHTRSPLDLPIRYRNRSVRRTDRLKRWWQMFPRAKGDIFFALFYCWCSFCTIRYWLRAWVEKGRPSSVACTKHTVSARVQSWRLGWFLNTSCCASKAYCRALLPAWRLYDMVIYKLFYLFQYVYDIKKVSAWGADESHTRSHSDLNWFAHVQYL